MNEEAVSLATLKQTIHKLKENAKTTEQIANLWNKNARKGFTEVPQIVLEEMEADWITVKDLDEVVVCVEKLQKQELFSTEKPSLKNQQCNGGMIIYPKGSPKIAFEGKHIYIFEEEPNPKTKIWSIFNYCNDFLGQISWDGQWRQYVLFAEKSKFGGSCFSEIGDFCKKQTQIQMDNWKKLKEVFGEGNRP